MKTTMLHKKVQMEKNENSYQKFKLVCWMDSNDTENFLHLAYAQNPNNEF